MFNEIILFAAGIGFGVVWNALMCYLHLPYDEGYHKAKALTALIPDYDSWVGLNPLCVRLQMALLAQDFVKGIRIIEEFGNFHYSFN